MRARQLLIAVAAVALAAVGPAFAQRPGVGSGLTVEGRQLDPVGAQIDLGHFPTGGALSPDGRFYWAVDAGRRANFVHVVDVARHAVAQKLPIPGGFLGVAFAPDGRRAYVSGVALDGPAPKGVELKGTGGDVIHVFEVDPDTGHASELAPIQLPDADDGRAADDELPPASNVAAWPQGMAVSPDGKLLVVALGQADQLAIIDLASKSIRLADTVSYPHSVAIDRGGKYAFVTGERGGIVDVIELPGGGFRSSVGVGGDGGDLYAHAEGITADPNRDRVYVAVTHRDHVAVIDTQKLEVERYLPVRLTEAHGSAPVAVAVSPDGQTLYAANAGEDAVVGVALADRPKEDVPRRTVSRSRSVASIGRYRRLAADTRHSRRLSAQTKARRLRRARSRYLVGKRVVACGGPSARADRAWRNAVLAAYTRRARDRRAGASRRAAKRRFDAAIRRALRRRPEYLPCAAGYLPGLKRGEVIGRLPTASYTSDVEVTPDGKRLVWLAARGPGAGDNAAGQDIDDTLPGRAGVLKTPSDRELRALTARAERQLRPSNAAAAPPGTPIVGPDGGASTEIKHVFYVVRENRTYDSIFGTERRGEGEPRLQLFDDNGVPGATGGVTPNAHALSRRFSLLDSVYADSAESTEGHKITAGGYATDYTRRKVQSGRGRKGNPDIFPIGVPPNGFIFDQAVRQGVSQHIYGEIGAGNQPFADDGRPTFERVFASVDPAYPTQLFAGCDPLAQDAPLPIAVRCTADSGRVGATAGPAVVQSRINVFQANFQAQVLTGTVPALNYLILFNDHTNGRDPDVLTPKTMVADNDLALGQLVQLVSQSPIWSESAILVVEDDSQAGYDHVDAHRMPALVISPWAKRGGVTISNRYDHYSFLRTAELILGLRPLNITDALATPLYDAFISGDEKPDVEGTRYTAIQPQQSMGEVNPSSGAFTRLSAALPWDIVDAVPQPVAERILWASVHGDRVPPPPLGPNSSAEEIDRAEGVMAAYRRGADLRAWLVQHGDAEEDG